MGDQRVVFGDHNMPVFFSHDMPVTFNQAEKLYKQAADGSWVEAPPGVWSAPTTDITTTFYPTDRSITLNFDTTGTATIEDPAPYTVTFEGEFQGVVYAVTINIIDESPIDAVIAEVFDLDEGEEVLSVLVGLPDGSTEVRPCRNSRRS